MVSILGTVIMIVGNYSVFGYLDPWGLTSNLAYEPLLIGYNFPDPDLQ